jgi:hypothetical protein
MRPCYEEISTATPERPLPAVAERYCVNAPAAAVRE